MTILHLDTEVIERMMETRPDLKLAIECIVAKDVTVKMYMMNKVMSDMDTKRKKTDRKPETCHKSSSLDAINTGWKGLMRSYFWCDFGQDGSGRSVNPISENFHQNISAPKNFTFPDFAQKPHPLVWPNRGQIVTEIR